MEILLLISFTDGIANFMQAFGFPKGVLCNVQGGFLAFFFLASWLWTLLLNIQLYSLIMYSKFILNRIQIHFLVWGYSLLFTLLPLATTRGYGVDDATGGLSVCVLEAGNHFQVQSVWGIMQFEFPLLMCMSTMTVLCFKVWLRYNNVYYMDTDSAVIVRKLIHVLILYPLFMIFCWMPIIVMSLMADNNYAFQSFNYHLIVSGSLNCLGSSYGFWLFVIYFSSSAEARYKWGVLLYNLFYNNIVNPDETLTISFPPDFEVNKKNSLILYSILINSLFYDSLSFSLFVGFKLFYSNGLQEDTYNDVPIHLGRSVYCLFDLS